MMEIQDTCIESVADLTSFVRNLTKEKDFVWWFRGHASIDWKLLPSIRRGYSPQKERQMAHDFYVRARTRYQNCPTEEDYAGWLALMQHYTLPTRLLDWSGSPLVATFFATFPDYRVSYEKSDAIIWALAPVLLNECQGFWGHIYSLNAKTLRPFLEAAFKEPDPDKEIKEIIVAARPLETDSRMFTQQAGFTVHVRKDPLDQIENAEQWLKRIIIPAKAVPEVAEEIKALGFRLADIFPDLYSLATELRSLYR
jgi:hypothetical protein